MSYIPPEQLRETLISTRITNEEILRQIRMLNQNLALVTGLELE